VKGRHRGHIASAALAGACALSLLAWVPGRAAGGAVPSPPGLPHYGGPSTTGTAAIRSDMGRAQLRGADRMPLDGRGTSIAVIDTGIDPTHPAFSLPDGGTKLVRSLSALPCLAPEQAGISDGSCITDLPTGVDSDTGHGGHGSMVSGVAVGNSYTLPDGTHVGGVAPGARVVMISATATLIGLHNGFTWVLQHHARPCGDAVPASTCPPIRVLSCSWGANDPVLTTLEDQLAAAGVLTVWANGNQGGDGSSSNSNPSPSLDPTPGVLTVASYDDGGTGTRDGKVSSGSSRGDGTKPQTWPDISAPGDNIISACRPYLAVCMAIGTGPKNGPGPNDVGTYNTASGTSFSAPALAGVIAMMFQADPDATAAHVDDVLKLTAYKLRDGAPYQKLGRYTSSFDKGAGLVDAYAAALRMGATGQDDVQQDAQSSHSDTATQPLVAAAVSLPNTAAPVAQGTVLLAVTALLLFARRRMRRSRR
jgi:serine protease AprX